MPGVSGTEYLRELEPRMAVLVDAWHLGARVTGVSFLPGGQSGLTYIARLENAPVDSLVVKVAVPGIAPVRNRDVLRQARLLTFLAPIPGVPVPAIYFEDLGDPPEIPPLFAMECVAGESFDPNLDAEVGSGTAEEVNGRAHSAARILANLHAVPTDDAIFRDETVLTLEAEAERWTKALRTVDDDLKGGGEECGALLLSTMPTPMDPHLIHGDFRLGNLMCEGDRVNGVIDWEIWGLSDPRLDVAWFMLAADPVAHILAWRDFDGMPEPEELRRSYEEAAGTKLDSLEWFIALAQFKLAAVSALIVKHRRQTGDTDSDWMRHVTPAIPSIIEHAAALIRS